MVSQWGASVKTSPEDIRKGVEALVRDVTTYDEKIAPKKVIDNLNKWKWGSYGWTSPVNLIITASWYKYYHPAQDVCKIWANDVDHNVIPGGFSIRNEDESITVPIFAKYDLCTNFCSPNSGMQGSRAIEKMRDRGRLDVNFGNAQKTIFDLKLFALILNQINDCTHEEVLEVFKYLIVTAKKIKAKRLEINKKLQTNEGKYFDFMNFLANTADPELTKCIVAACFEAIYDAHGLKLEGVEDYKTAADARAQKPGDISFTKDGMCKVAVEVKDKSQTIDWNNIDRAKKILERHQTVESFIFALENRSATITDVVEEMIDSPQFDTYPCKKIMIFSLHDIYYLSLAVTTKEDLVKRISYFVSIAPAVKPETKTAWVKKLESLP